MPKKFNVTGICIPGQHYMADISGKIDTITTDYVQQGKYFTINRARQYGKTTLLYLLERQLKERYLVIQLSFEAADELFVSLHSLAVGLSRKISRSLRMQNIRPSLLEQWNQPISEQFPLDDFSERITALCQNSDKEIVLIIDEIDKNSNNQIFMSLLGLLRNKYLEQLKQIDHTFKSVILAGVYDIKNLKLKLRSDEEAKYNSPWNVAADFWVDLSFHPEHIAAMLQDYEHDYSTGMDIQAISQLIYDYTSGYPYLVSRICQLADERLVKTESFPDRHSVWTPEGIVAAELLLRKTSNTLFDDLIKKLVDYPKLKQIVQDILFCGRSYPFERENFLINLGVTFGFLKEKNETVAIDNRIFETKLYDLFISEAAVEDTFYQTSALNRNQYIINGTLQMKRVMETFYRHFTEIYCNSDDKFLETHGRKIFLLYLKPIINGSGNYYIESQTRDGKRTDVIVDFYGTRYIIELKIWHGKEYNQRGEEQLFEYLDYYNEGNGYLLSFNFNKHKITGIREISRNGKHIFEVVV